MHEDIGKGKVLLRRMVLSSGPAALTDAQLMRK
jgi:hypothetical protein